jgi:hypothetical protein
MLDATRCAAASIQAHIVAGEMFKPVEVAQQFAGAGHGHELALSQVYG